MFSQASHEVPFSIICKYKSRISPVLEMPFSIFSQLDDGVGSYKMFTLILPV